MAVRTACVKLGLLPIRAGLKAAACQASPDSCIVTPVHSLAPGLRGRLPKCKLWEPEVWEPWVIRRMVPFQGLPDDHRISTWPLQAPTVCGSLGFGWPRPQTRWTATICRRPNGPTTPCAVLQGRICRIRSAPLPDAQHLGRVMRAAPDTWVDLFQPPGQRRYRAGPRTTNLDCQTLTTPVTGGPGGSRRLFRNLAVPRQAAQDRDRVPPGPRRLRGPSRTCRSSGRTVAVGSCPVVDGGVVAVARSAEMDTGRWHPNGLGVEANQPTQVVLVPSRRQPRVGNARLGDRACRSRMWVMCWGQPCCVVGGVARADAAVVLDPFPSERVLQATVATPLAGCPIEGPVAGRPAACRVIQF